MSYNVFDRKYPKNQKLHSTLITLHPVEIGWFCCRWPIWRKWTIAPPTVCCLNHTKNHTKKKKKVNRSVLGTNCTFRPWLRRSIGRLALQAWGNSRRSRRWHIGTNHTWKHTSLYILPHLIESFSTRIAGDLQVGRITCVRPVKNVNVHFKHKFFYVRSISHQINL